MSVCTREVIAGLIDKIEAKNFYCDTTTYPVALNTCKEWETLKGAFELLLFGVFDSEAATSQ